MSIVVNKTRLPVTQWQTASGSVVSISDARKRYAKSLSVELEPIQDLHGYANPWVGGAGVNQCNPSTMGNGFIQGQGAISTSTTNGERYQPDYVPITGSKFSVGYFNYADGETPWTGVAFYDSNKTFISRDSAYSNPKSYAVPQNAVYARATMRTYAHGNEYCFCANGEVLTYSPYANLCPISGRSSVTAVRDGKNLLDTENILPASLKSTNFISIPLDTKIYVRGRTESISVKLLGELGADKTRFALYIYDTKNNNAFYVGGSQYLTAENGYSLSGLITVSSTGTDTSNPLTLRVYAQPYTGDSVSAVYGLMISFGTDTAYEPYQGTSVTLSLGQTVYGGSVDLVSGVMTATKKSVTFIGDNSYSWYIYDPDNYDSFCFAVDLPDKSKKKLTSICDKYKNVDASWGAGGDGKYCVFSDHTTLARLYFRPPYSGFGETVADWKTWLSNNPLQVCYELATPQTIQLSTNQIEMLMRNNTVLSDAGVVTLEYARIRQ